jgi:hypothetical protein
MNTSHFNIIAYIVAVIVYYSIGWIWYAMIFGKTWAKEKGITMEGSSPVLPMLGQLAASVLYTLGVYWVVMLGGFSTWMCVLIVGSSVTGFFVIPLLSGSLLFEKKPKLFLIDVGYNLVSTFIMAIILIFWR